jgi:hypothetical protein
MKHSTHNQTVEHTAHPAGSTQQEAGSRKQEAGSRKQEGHLRKKKTPEMQQRKNRNR